MKAFADSQLLYRPAKTPSISQSIAVGFGPLQARDEAIRMIRRMGRKNWKKRIGYHCRSLVETAVSRLKTIFGPILKNRTLPNQLTEARLRCKILNHFTHYRLAYAHPN